MWQIFIATFLDWWGNPIWSSLIHFGQIWSKKIKNKTAIFILSVNVTTFYRNIFRLVRKSNLIKFDQVWSILDGSDPKKSKNKTAIFLLFKNVTTLYTNIFCYVQPLKSCFFSDRHTYIHTQGNRTDIVAQIVV